MPSEFGLYTGHDLLKEEEPGESPLIQNILYQGDVAFFVAEEKSGKSIFGLQLACALTSGEPLFGMFEVPEPHMVLYVQAEGRRSETSRRLQVMVKTLQFNPELFRLLWTPGLELDTITGRNQFIQQVSTIKPAPKLIIIDPLYTSVRGNLSDGEVTSGTIRTFRMILDAFQTSLFVFHHAHRMKRDLKGFEIDEGDDILYGSKFWKACADHIFLGKMDKKAKRLVVTCDTQRTANIVDKMDLILREPDPLHFESIEATPHPATGESRQGVEDYLRKHEAGCPIHEIQQALILSRRTVFYCLGSLLREGKVSKDRPNGRGPAIYSLKQSG